MPESPLSQLQVGAAQLHELFTSFQEAGFSRRESLTLTCTVLKATFTPRSES